MKISKNVIHSNCNKNRGFKDVVEHRGIKLNITINLRRYHTGGFLEAFQTDSADLTMRGSLFSGIAAKCYNKSAPKAHGDTIKMCGIFSEMIKKQILLTKSQCSVSVVHFNIPPSPPSSVGYF